MPFPTFPPPESADEDGLVAMGGELSPQRLLEAYRSGIFPWPTFGGDFPIPWVSPDPRAIIELDRLHVSRRLARTIRSGKFQATCDRDFAAVIAGCALPRREDGGTWITDEMKLAYFRMHQLGHAHSVEVWHQGRLAGGLYGMAIGGFFAGESMFYRVRDASKVALVSLVKHLARRGYVLFDIQQLTEHTWRMGAREIRRAEYLRRLAAAVDLPVTFGDRLEG
jgi:leucyl/phenylalanyl-tRNA--protein transferase